MSILNSPRRLRRTIQIVFALICLLAGARLLAFCLWATGSSSLFVSRPPVAEGFLPISALIGLKYFLFTGRYDPVHPAGLTILITALVLALVLRKSFCGYICPVGLLSDLLAGLGRRLGLARRDANAADLVLRQVKFVLLALCLFLFLSMSLDAIAEFQTSQHNITADAAMLRFFLHPSTATLIVFGVLILLSLVFHNVWCRWLCPYGALLGLLAWFGPVRVTRHDAACTKCGRCEKACPAGIRIRRKTAIRAPECLGCAQCLEACPESGALDVRAAGRPLPWPVLGLGAAGLILSAWLIAWATGHWEARLPVQMIRGLYAMTWLGR